MIHIFNFINEVIIKSNHFIKKMKLILRKIVKNYLIIMFQIDALNDYYVVRMYLLHVYKTSFIFVLKQFCYLKMS